MRKLLTLGMALFVCAGLHAQSVVDIIVGSPDHQTLEDLVIAAELADDLSGNGPFTVFAPTDAAFDALPGWLVTQLTNDPTGELANVLLYHVAGAEALSTDLANGDMIETLLGPDVMVTIDGDVFINGAMVTTADIMADNGVVHVIDAVLTTQPVSVVDVVVGSPDHETLETAVVAAELADDLSTEGPFTVFAPTDDAFAALPEWLLTNLLDDPTGALADVLLYHVVGAEALSTDLSDGDMFETLLGDAITVTIDGNVMINGAMVTVADIQTYNGVVHVIDAVLTTQPATVVDVVVGSPDHETLETAVVAAGLADDLMTEGPFTVFAPTDDAFAALPAWLLENLLDDPTGALANVLLYHVVGAQALSGDLMDGDMFETLYGDDITVTIDGNVMINDAMVTVADIQTYNGVVHVIDAVLTYQPGTVVDVVVGSDNHETLEELVIAAELADDLSSEGPFTLFAPTDEAFMNLPAWLLADLAADPTGELANVLLYHAVGATALSGDLMDGDMFETLLGEDITVTIDGNVMINNAMVTVADIETFNGVVHVIDAVLTPQPVTVVDVVVGSPDHETLETAVIAAELADELSDAGPLTVFAPTDDAFAALPAWLLENLLDDPTGALAEVLLYHVVGAQALSGDLMDGDMFETLLGQDITVTIDGNVMINNAMVTVADIQTYNGVVHVIDAVLTPQPATVVDVVVSSVAHETLETAVVAAGLADDLSEEGPFTVFAPTDDAFANLPAWLLENLLDDPTGELANVLLYHVVGAEALSGTLMDGDMFETLLGEDITVTIDGDVMINDAMVTVVDIQTYNGVVHVIDGVLLPKPATVVDVVVNSPTHETLETAVIAAMLADDLSEEGPFTLFAPDDAAFANVDPDALTDLLADPLGALTDVLLYHAVGATALSGDLMDGDEFATLEGNSVVITIDGGMVMVNDATVIAADIETYNGVVHVIDRVLTLPNNIDDAEGTAFTAYPIPADAQLNLQVAGDTQLLGVRLIDMQGRVALEIQQGNVRTLDVSALPAGVYTLQVLTAQGQSQKAVVIR